MLTVMRDMAAHVASRLAHMRPPRLGPDAEGDEQERVLADILEEAIVAGEASVRRGPELLPGPARGRRGRRRRLRRDRHLRRRRGRAARRGGAARWSTTPPRRVSHPEHESSTYRYCTNFAVTGGDLDAARYVGALEGLGDSVLVVGDRTTLKVHVHTDDPETAIAVFDGAGEVSRLDVADMRAQVAQREARLTNGHAARSPAPACSPSSRGPGMARAVRVAGSPRARRRPDAQPLHARAAGRHPRRARRGGRRPAQQRQRDHGGRAGRRAGREGGARRRLALAAGGAGRRRGADGRRGRRRQRRRDARGDRRGAHRRRRARRPRGPRRALRRGRGRRASSRTSSSPGARRRRRSRRCSPRWPPTPSS